MSKEPSASVEEILLSLQGLLSILVWAARHGHDSVCEQLVMYFVQEAPKGPHLLKLAEVQARRPFRAVLTCT